MTWLKPRSLFFGTSGPTRPGTIMVVGEAWGEEEAKEELPFVGSSGRLFSQLLSTAGLDRTALLLTNVVAHRPPSNKFWALLYPADQAKNPALKYLGLHCTPELVLEHQRLLDQIDAVRPALIIALGNYALWATTEVAKLKRTPKEANGPKFPDGSRIMPSGITQQRGSQLYSREINGRRYPVLPTLHPAGVMRQMSQARLLVHDLIVRVPLRDAWAPPPVSVNSRPTVDDVMLYLTTHIAIADGGAPQRFSHDVETARGAITCMALATSPHAAIVIPFIDKRDGAIIPYWSILNEVRVRRQLTRFFAHPNVSFIGQNYNYDRAYVHEEYGVIPRLHGDTNTAQYVLTPGEPKDLGMLSSLYCAHHRFWKDDSKDWAERDDMTIDQHFLYNADDAMRTWEIHENQMPQLRGRDQWSQYQERLAVQDWCYTTAAQGIRSDHHRRSHFHTQLSALAEARHHYLLGLFSAAQINALLKARSTAKTWKESRAPWYSSNQKLAVVLYDILDLPRQYDPKTREITTDDEALEVLAAQFPQFRLLFSLISDMRSIRVYKSTFLEALPEPSGRFRTSLEPATANTFRLSSSGNAFRRGLNLQNIPGE